MQCIYDNPRTWTRDCWIDGELVFFISSQLVTDLPLAQLYPEADIGPWKPGQVVGDAEAIDADKHPLDAVVIH